MAKDILNKQDYTTIKLFDIVLLLAGVSFISMERYLQDNGYITMRNCVFI